MNLLEKQDKSGRNRKMVSGELKIYKNKKYSALFVSKYLIVAARERGIQVSNLKLQKLLYFLQGLFFSLTNEFLFDDDFVAWNYGPAIPRVYCEYRYNSSEPILAKFPGISFNNMDELVKTVVSIVLSVFGKYSAQELADAMRHEKPWQKHHNGSNATIPKKEIAESFAV